MHNMFESQAIVIAKEAGKIIIEAHKQSACSACRAKNSCGTSVLSKHLSGSSHQLKIDCHEELHIGQKVIIGVKVNELLLSGSVTYLLPIISLILCMLLLSQFDDLPQFIEILAALSSLAVGIIMIKLMMKNSNECEIQFIKRIDN